MISTEDKWGFTRETVGDDRLSIVMPLYRLAAEAKENLIEVARLFESHGVNTELVPVDDGSGDGTADILTAFNDCHEFSHVVFKPVICRKNGGKGSALRAGFEASTGRYVMLLDGDLDIHPGQTPHFFEAMVTKGADIVVGSKRHPKSVVQYPWHRRIVSACYFTFVKIVFGLHITDTQTGMKLFKREVLGPALDRMLVKTYAFDLELLSIAASRGAKIAEAPVVIRFGNKFGALKPKTVSNMAKDTLAVFYRLRLLKYYAKCLVPQKLDHDPLVSVVIACPKRSWMLDECLQAIAGQSYEKWEVIVLPDGEDEVKSNSEKGKSEEESGDSRIRVIPTGKVRPAEKRNIGIREAKGEIIAFIDDDAYPDVHWLEYAIKYFGDRDIGAVGGPGVTPPGDTRLAYLGGRVYDNWLVTGTYHYRYRAGGVRMDVEDYPSCNLFVRKDLLEKIGGYRTDFWPGEDTLLCKDIVDNWKRIIYDPWVIVYHHRRPLFLSHLRQLGRYGFHRGYFCKRFPSNSLRLSYFVPTFFDIYLLVLAVVGILNLTGVDCLRITFHRWGGYLPLWIYLVLVGVTTFSFKPHHWLLTAAGVISSHVWYGVRFIQGLCAKRAPCEYIGKDHAHGDDAGVSVV